VSVSDVLAQQRPQRVALALDLLLGPEAEPAQDRKRRAPALQRVLEQEALHRDRQREPAPPARECEREAAEAEQRRQRLDRALDVPFGVDLVEPAPDPLR